LTFEAWIERHAFWGCKALKFICISQGIQQLEKDSYVRSSLARVIFESSASLQAMIQCWNADLEGRFEINLVDWDGVATFPGYSVCTIPGVDNSVRLVKNE
jgi:hypothetical protein